MHRTRIVVAALAAALALPACTDQQDPLAPSPSAGVVPQSPQYGSAIKIMNQNMYLGANLDLLLTASGAEDLALVFQQLETSTLAGNFGRAQQMALQIAMEAPHLVGLQEVSTYVFTTPLGSQTLDFLYVLEQYLNYFHAYYGTPAYTAVRADWTTVYVPTSLFDASFPDVTYTDGDAVLVRSDVSTGYAVTKAYDDYEIFSVAGTTFDNKRGYIALDATIDGQTVHFVSTHIEVQAFEETQLKQTAELIESVKGFDVPVIIVGDLNSAGNHDASDDQVTDSWHMLRNAGFADVWLRQKHSVSGYTCCQGPDLTNEASELHQRLDMVLVRSGNAGFAGKSAMDILGDEAGDRIGVGDLTLWPSDHAAVVATLWFPHGRRAE